jgi:hypothetical protein
MPRLRLILITVCACHDPGRSGSDAIFFLPTPFGDSPPPEEFILLDAQAKAIGLPRSTAWTILSAEHKATGLSARIICQMLSSNRLPLLVRAKIIEYAEERAAGI